MKMRWLSVALAMTVLWVQGCLIITGNHHKEASDSPERYGADPQDATVVEISAVSKLSFDNSRQEAYRRIAGREGISEGAQVYLVVAVFKHLSFENMQMEVLTTLIANPSFSPAAKKAILDRLDKLSFENNKTTILDAMAKR
jgi:hypothetical protein